jgi:murein DD-endopeptidase MepM/ murein hydrolase activator NlpD
LGSVSVKQGQDVEAGQPLGTVGTVLEIDQINQQSPAYVQALKQTRISSMLHLELHTAIPLDTPDYLGGNFFLGQPPSTLLDPSPFLFHILREQEEHCSVTETKK